MTQNTTASVTIARLYPDFPTAQAAVERLRGAGLDDDSISVIANNSEKWCQPDWGRAATKGGAVGAGFGGVGGLLAGFGLLAIPGLGPVVAAGWPAATLAGAVSVGLAGAVIGMMAEAGVATNEAEVYAESIRRGGSFVSVRAPAARRAEFETLLNPGAVDAPTRRAQLTASRWRRPEPGTPAYKAAEVQKERPKAG
jgi:hypothetical protein